MFPLLVLVFLVISIVQAQLPPSLDPFYRPPAGFAAKPPGTILRTRPIIAANLGIIPEPVEAYQLLYRTRSINGSAIATVTTIFKPFNAQQDRFVSFQAAEDSAWIDCAPSYNYRLGDVPTNPIIDFENLLLQAYLAAGFIVSSPDYEGPDAAFATGHLEGYSVLDSMRAAQSFLGGNKAIVGTGYSGGAIATGWAASLHATYAPELNVKGWSIGGTPANLTGTLLFLDGTIFSGFLPAAVDGLNKPSSYRALLDPVLESIATPYGKSILAVDNVNCGPTALITFAGQSVLSYDFQSLGPALLYQPVVAAILQQQTMGVNISETPRAPVLLYHATQDEIIPYANASTLYHSWCDHGAKVHFSTYAAGGHLTTEIFGLVPAIRYAQAAFAGTVPMQCSMETVLDPAVDPLALGLDVEPILVELLNKLVSLGPQDENLFNNLATTGQVA